MVRNVSQTTSGNPSTTLFFQVGLQSLLRFSGNHSIPRALQTSAAEAGGGPNRANNSARVGGRGGGGGGGGGGGPAEEVGEGGGIHATATPQLAHLSHVIWRRPGESRRGEARRGQEMTILRALIAPMRKLGSHRHGVGIPSETYY